MKTFSISRKLVLFLSLYIMHCACFMTRSLQPNWRASGSSKISAPIRRGNLDYPVSQKNNLFPLSLGITDQLTSLVAARPLGVAASLVGVAVAVLAFLNKILWTPSRTYNKEKNTVAAEYDAWTEEGILEYYWGEHIHLGFYSEEEIRRGYKKKNFIQGKQDFIDEMIKFGKFPEAGTSDKPIRILDVGCGIGGTTRYLAKKLGANVSVTGITLSPKQVRRATELAKSQNIDNVEFKVMDALAMSFDDNSFDYVWACESGEHMPDKKRYVEEMTRVLRPEGRMVVATWCQRDINDKPFSNQERKMLDFLYAEWTHPYFISISDYAKLMKGTAMLKDISTDDWTKWTIPSWRHSIWVGVYDPWPVVVRPHLWWKCLRDGITLERMHQAFESKLMQYGMMTAVKATQII